MENLSKILAEASAAAAKQEQEIIALHDELADFRSKAKKNNQIIKDIASLLTQLMD